MSWSDFLDASFKDVKAYVAIAGHNGVTWGKKDGADLIPAEVVPIVDCLTKQNYEPLQVSGFKVAGRKFKFLSINEDCLIGKDNATSTAVKTTKQTIVMVSCDGEGSAQTSVMHACNLAKYLEGRGY